MKYFLTLTLILFYLTGYSQFIENDTTKLIINNANGFQYKRWKVDDNLIIPHKGDTTSRNPGEIKVLGTGLYFTGSDRFWHSAGASGQVSTEITTVTALRAKTVITPPNASTLYVTTDGRQWVWNATSTSTDNTGTILKATAITTGRWEALINDVNLPLSWFGLTGSSTIDETSKMQVYFDEAFRLKKHAYLDVADTFYMYHVKPKVSIDGNYKTMLKTFGGSTMTFNAGVLEYINISDFFVRGFSIDGNYANVEGSEALGIACMVIMGTDTTNRPKNAIIEKMRFQNNKYVAVAGRLFDNLVIRDSYDTLTDCMAVMREGDGFYCYNNKAIDGTSETFSLWGEDSLHVLKNAVIRDNIIIRRSGVSQRYVDGYTIANNTFTDGLGGIFATVIPVHSAKYTARNGDIYGNKFSKCQTGVSVAGMHINVHDNSADSLTLSSGGGFTAGVTAYTSYEIDIHDNTVINAGLTSTPIGVFNVKYSTIHNNTVRDTRATAGILGIQIDSSVGVSMHNNRIEGAATFTKVRINRSDSISINDHNGQVRIDTSRNTLVEYATGLTNNNSATTRINFVGTTTANASALLDVESTTKGILIPRMTNIQIHAIVSPATSLLVYDTTNSVFAYYTGSGWQQLTVTALP